MLLRQLDLTHACSASSHADCGSVGFVHDSIVAESLPGPRTVGPRFRVVAIVAVGVRSHSGKREKAHHTSQALVNLACFCEDPFASTAL